MALTIDETSLSATLTGHPMTDGEFAEFSSEHPDLFLEMTAQGEIIVMPSTYTLTGVRDAEITGQLGSWAKQDSRGIATAPPRVLSSPMGRAVRLTPHGRPELESSS